MRTFKGTITISAIGLSKAAKILGSERILAEKIDVSRQSIQYWKADGLVPYNKALETSIATDGKVSLDELRPDLKSLNRKAGIFFSRFDKN